MCITDCLTLVLFIIEISTIIKLILVIIMTSCSDHPTVPKKKTCAIRYQMTTKNLFVTTVLERSVVLQPSSFLLYYLNNYYLNFTLVFNLITWFLLIYLVCFSTFSVNPGYYIVVIYILIT